MSKIEDAVQSTIRANGPHRKLAVGVNHNSSLDGPFHLATMLSDHSTMVELGCAHGESTMFWWLSGRFDKVFAIDPFLGLSKDDFDDPTDLLTQVVIPSHGVVEHIMKKSGDAVYMFADASLDFVYIDACHDYENVKNDISLYLPKIKNGGIIAGHDYCQDFPGTIAAVDEIFYVPDRVFTDTSWMKRVTR